MSCRRGDFQAALALVADDVDYVPPPLLSPTPIRGRSAVLRFWQAGPHTITAADPVPDDLRAALTKINNASPGAH